MQGDAPSDDEDAGSGSGAYDTETSGGYSGGYDEESVVPVVVPTEGRLISYELYGLLCAVH